MQKRPQNAISFSEKKKYNGNRKSQSFIWLLAFIKNGIMQASERAIAENEIVCKIKEWQISQWKKNLAHAIKAQIWARFSLRYRLDNDNKPISLRFKLCRLKFKTECK